MSSMKGVKMKQFLYYMSICLLLLINLFIGNLIYFMITMYYFDTPMPIIDDKVVYTLFFIINYLLVIFFNRVILKKINVLKKKKLVEFIIMLPMIYEYLFTMAIIIKAKFF